MTPRKEGLSRCDCPGHSYEADRLELEACLQFDHAAGKCIRSATERLRVSNVRLRRVVRDRSIVQVVERVEHICAQVERCPLTEDSHLRHAEGLPQREVG